MFWDRNHRSNDVIDERGAGGTSAAGVGGVGILFWLVSRFGLPGLLIGGAVLAGMYFLAPATGDPNDGQGLTARDDSAANGADEAAHFVGFVLDDVQTTWQRIFAERGANYSRAKLVLFNEAVRSGCGVGSAQVGPFYCPNDRRVYIDLAFYRQLAQRFGAPGDFAQAYVIAHEVGHHVQNLLGEGASARSLVRGTNRENTRSIQTELQADCYAGIWAHSTEQRDLLQAGDVEEGLRAAAAVGDDTLQRETQGRVSPETWTHGSSEQRVGWFKRGYTGGSLEACDTRGESAR